MSYLRTLRGIIAARGSQNIVYVDESGFERHSHRLCGWGPRGEKVHGECSGNKRPRTSLIAARRKRTLLAPMLFEGTADTELVDQWVETQLLPQLAPGSTIVFDNARFHNRKNLTAIAGKNGHHLLFLPPYSPDFNPIENDFANIKKQRQFKPPHTPIDDIVKSYQNYLK